MKSFAITFLISVTALAAVKSRNPMRVEQNLFEVFGHYYLWGDTHVKVKGPSYNTTTRDFYDQLEERGKSIILLKSFYQHTQRLARSVFRAFAADSRSHFGSAFHVGGNLVLTNHHVFRVKRPDDMSCGNFHIALNPPYDGHRLYCKKVHYCSQKMDYCLIEMWPSRYGRQLNMQRPPVLNPEAQTSFDGVFTAIGNTRGFGIHASTGRGFFYRDDILTFYAPVFSGNSGGALFNSSDEVVGVVRAQSANKFDENSFNVAIPLSELKKDLEKNLGGNYPALKLINWKAPQPPAPETPTSKPADGSSDEEVELEEEVEEFEQPWEEFGQEESDAPLESPLK